jgi:hypothetical protein
MRVLMGPAPAAAADPTVVRATEHWFLRRGLPHFIADYNASQDIWTRAVPALTVLFLLELFLAANVEWTWWQDVLAVAGALAIALAAWAFVNRMRGRPALRRPDDLGVYEIAVFVVVPAVVPLVFGGQVGQALSIAGTNVLLVALIYAVTSYGIVPMTRWGFEQIGRQVQSVFTLFFRALPLLILVLALLLFTAEMWQTVADMNVTRIALAIGFFVVTGSAFAVVRLPQQIGELSRFESWERTTERLRGTPIEPVVGSLAEPDGEAPGLSRRQWYNVGLVVLVSEAVQVFLVTVFVFAFFVAFGMATLTRGVMNEWVATDDGVEVLRELRIAGDTYVLTEELLKVSGFLAAFAGLYFMVVMLTDATYRREFLDEIVSDVRDAFAVRAAYLAYLGRGG